jgi:hypothetical protein
MINWIIFSLLVISFAMIFFLTYEMKLIKDKIIELEQKIIRNR